MKRIQDSAQTDVRYRQSGMVLLSSLVLVTVMLAITGYVLLFAVSETKVVREARDRSTAFYLAETGLELAKWEIGELQDPDLDGIGNGTASSNIGAYTVNAVDLGGGNYQLTSAGSAGESNVTLEVILRRRSDSRFPGGAISIVGNVSDIDVEIEEDADLILDGGNSPALSFSDVGLYNKFGTEIAGAINDGQMPAANISGAPTNAFGDPPVELPIVLQSSYDDSLKDLTALYTDLVSTVNALIPTATVVGPTFDPTYGAPDSPVVLYEPNLKLVNSQSITGHGTLIIGHELILGQGASLDWTGDIFVVGEAARDAKLKVEGGNLNVTGNLIVLGEGVVNTTLKVARSGHITVNGSLFFGTDWATRDADSRFEIEEKGGLTVNGLVTMIGSDVEIEFEPVRQTSDPDNKVSINGMLQVAVPNSSTETQLELELEGDGEIRKNDSMIQQGLGALSNLDVNYDLARIDQLINRNALTALAWRRVNN